MRTHGRLDGTAAWQRKVLPMPAHLTRSSSVPYLAGGHAWGLIKFLGRTCRWTVAGSRMHTGCFAVREGSLFEITAAGVGHAWGSDVTRPAWPADYAALTPHKRRMTAISSRP